LAPHMSRPIATWEGKNSIDAAAQCVTKALDYNFSSPRPPLPGITHRAKVIEEGRIYEIIPERKLQRTSRRTWTYRWSRTASVGNWLWCLLARETSSQQDGLIFGTNIQRKARARRVLEPNEDSAPSAPSGRQPRGQRCVKPSTMFVCEIRQRARLGRAMMIRHGEKDDGDRSNIELCSGVGGD
jgi:hypothetical protein